jgi:hypothetical protein
MRKQDSIAHAYHLRYTTIKYKLKSSEFVI